MPDNGVQHVAEDYEYVADKRMTADSQGLFISNTQAYYDSMACAQSTKAPDTENPDAYYDPNHNFSVPNNC